MPATLRDIAATLGVSVQTVSCALRGRPNVSAALRERVQIEAERRGYRPHVGARAMGRGDFGAITLVQDAKGGYSFLTGALLRGIIAETERGGRRLGITRLSRAQMEDREALPCTLRELCADGLLLNLNIAPPAAFATVLRRLRIPCIWLNIRRDGDCVHPDDHGAAAALVQELVRRGSTRIGYVDLRAHEPDAHYSRQERHAGYRQAMLAAGLLPDALLGDPDDAYDRTIGGFTAWLRARPDLQALVAYGGIELDLLHHRIRSRPDLRLASFFSPKDATLTPVLRAELPTVAMAVAALEELTAKIAAPRRVRPPRALPFAIHDPELPLGW